MYGIYNIYLQLHCIQFMFISNLDCFFISMSSRIENKTQTNIHSQAFNQKTSQNEKLFHFEIIKPFKLIKTELFK